MTRSPGRLLRRAHGRSRPGPIPEPALRPPPSPNWDANYLATSGSGVAAISIACRSSLGLAWAFDPARHRSVIKVNASLMQQPVQASVAGGAHFARRCVGSDEKTPALVLGEVSAAARPIVDRHHGVTSSIRLPKRRKSAPLKVSRRVMPWASMVATMLASCTCLPQSECESADDAAQRIPPARLR